MKTRRRLLLAIALIVVTASCKDDFYQSQTTTDQQSFGTVNVAITQIAHWDDYVKSLSPNFKLDSEGALKLSLPTTAYAEERALDVLAGSLGVGFEQKSKVRTISNASSYDISNGEATGTSSSSLDTVATNKPGEAPDAADPNTPTQAPALPTRESGELGTDPLLRYTAATALLQEVTLLNKYVENAALRRRSDPYLVRVQLQVVPYARNYPYDVYSLLGFFAKEANPITALPLLVTDNLEQTATSRISETLRAISIAATALQGNTGFNAGLQRTVGSINSVLGSDANSLLTVGRVTDNAISVRLGAARQATAEYATLPRTHNITLLVMVRRKDGETASVLFHDTDPSDEKPSQLTVNNRWRARDANTGKELYARTDYEQLTDFGEKLSERLGLGKKSITPAQARDIANHVYFGEFSDFKKAIKLLANGSHKENDIQYFWRNIWMESIALIQEQPQSSARADFPDPIRISAPNNNQSIMLIDDEETTSVATIRNGSNLQHALNSANLKLAYKDNSFEYFPATSVTASADGSSLIAAFPSLKSLGLNGLKTKGQKLQGSSISINMKLPNERFNESVEKPHDPRTKSAEFQNVYYVTRPQPPRELVKLQRAVTTIQPNAGVGDFELKVSFVKETDTKVAASVEIAVDGASIVKVENAADSSKVDHEFGVFRLSQDTVVKLELKNLVPGQKVTLKAETKDAADKKLGKPVSAEVSIAKNP